MADASAPMTDRPLGRPLAVILAALLVAALAVPWGRVLAQTGDPVLLNELLVSHTGADTTEFFELYGTPGHSLAGLSLVVVDGDASLAGTIDLRIDFPSDARLGGNGFYLVGNPTGLAANYGVAPDLALPASDLVPNGSQTVALVTTASVGAEDSTVTGSEDVLDAVGLSDGGPADAWFWEPQTAVLPTDDGFLPAGAHRVVNGADTDSADDWAFADDLLGPTNTPTPATPFEAATPTPTPSPTPTPTPTPVEEPTSPAATPDVSALVDLLQQAIDGGAVAPKVVHQLSDRLDRVQRFLDSGQWSAALAQLRAFANQVQGFAPRWVDQAAADDLSVAAAELGASLGTD